MAISEIDTKILWGRAAGICSNPRCRAELTKIIEAGRFHLGEMAHVIAKKESGPRGVKGGGADTYDNLILLCPTCHTMIDKAPEGAYPAESIREWKREHEAAVSSAASGKKFGSTAELKSFVSGLLIENRAIWKHLGPHSLTAQNDPGSNLQRIWETRRLDSIIPNNRKIINSIETNKALLCGSDLDAYIEFKVHAQAYEEHVYDRVDAYPLFPAKFAEAFQNE